jgi:hypothetical protein
MAAKKLRRGHDLLHKGTHSKRSTKWRLSDIEVKISHGVVAWPTGFAVLE